MNANIFAEWLRRQGHKVFRTPSSFWYNKGSHVYQAFPYHWLIEPDKNEIQQLLREKRVLGLRYSTPLSAKQGFVSYHVVYENDQYTLDALPKKARYDVRKGLKHYKVAPVSMQRMAGEGWLLRAETLARQGRSKAESPRWWRQLCQIATDLKGFESWGAFVGSDLVASLLAFTCDSCCSILYQQSRTEFMSKGVNNALTFVFTEAVLRRSGVHEIFYGLHSLDAPDSVDQYKFRMNFFPKPVRQRVVFHPRVRLLFNRTSHWGIQKLLKLFPSRSALAKAEGMFRFYLEGQRPLYEQTWPPALERQKAQLLRRKSL